MWADEAASLATRPRKDGSLTPEVLREEWQAEVDGIGMPTGHALDAQVCGRTIPMLRPRLEWDDLGRQAYEKDLQRYGDLDSVESRRRQSRLDFFLIEAESMRWDSTLQAMSYAMETVADIEERESR